MADIKESMEVLEGLEAIVVAVKASLADGKIGLDDIKNLFAASPKVMAAVKGAQLIPGELGDLSKEEMQELLVKIGAIVMQIVGIFTVSMMSEPAVG